MKKLTCLLGSSLIGLSVCSYASSTQNVTVDECFTPGGACTNMIVNSIHNANKSIDVQAYGFTSQPIINALVKAKQRGVDVRVILDKSNLSGKNKVIPLLQQNKIPLWIDYKVRIAHNKVMILDGDKVITGSFNFTSSAQNRNAENVAFLASTDVANSYEQNFSNRLAVSADYKTCLTLKKCSHSKYMSIKSTPTVKAMTIVQ